MSIERVLPASERQRRNTGMVITGIGAVPLGALLAVRYQTGRINPSLAIIGLVLVVFTVVGLRLAIKRELYLEIDRGARTCRLVQDGRRGPVEPLDTLGPLQVSQRLGPVQSRRTTRNLIEYAVHPTMESESDDTLDLHVETTPGRARVKLERLARAWALPSRSFNGDLRRPDELDMPLHQRLRGDEQARRPATLRPEWGLEVRPLEHGHVIVSRHRARSELSGAGCSTLLAVPLVMLLVVLFRPIYLTLAPEIGIDDASRMSLGALALVALLLLGNLARALRNTFFPGAVRITTDGVAYRFSRIALDDIEEVSAHLGVEVIGDRRTVRIPDYFCPLEAYGPLAHEIRARIIEMGRIAMRRDAMSGGGA